jgi:hypothetical protein
MDLLQLAVCKCLFSIFEAILRIWRPSPPLLHAQLEDAPYYSDEGSTYFPDINGMIKSRRMSWTGHVVCIGKMRNGYIILLGKTEMERPLQRPRHICEGSIKK